MKAKEYVEKYIKKEYQKKFHVLSIIADAWYHIHLDEEIPKGEKVVLSFQGDK